jgi:mannose-6-phosphate isomerase
VAETGGLPIGAEDAHLGLGWDVMLDAFDRTARDAEWVDTLRHDGRRPAETGEGWRRTPLTDVAADPFFRAERLEVRGHARPALGPAAFTVEVVTGGAGTVRAGGRDLAVRAGDTFAVPAAVSSDLAFDAPDGLDLIVCLPPRPADLELP